MQNSRSAVEVRPTNPFTGVNNTYLSLTTCSYNMCGAGSSVAMAWFEGVVLSLAITLIISQPITFLAKFGFLPIVTRKLIRRRGDYGARVLEQAKKIEGERTELRADEVEKAAKKRDKRLRKEYKHKKKLKKGAIAPEEAKPVAIEGPVEVDESGEADYLALQAEMQMVNADEGMRGVQESKQSEPPQLVVGTSASSKLDGPRADTTPHGGA